MAAATNSCNSPSEAGATRAAGRHSCEPDQLRQGIGRESPDAAAIARNPVAWLPTAAAIRAPNKLRRLITVTGSRRP
ncbi:MAG: hypothetical protein R3E50_11710 [Halioglobus sp.]